MKTFTVTVAKQGSGPGDCPFPELTIPLGVRTHHSIPAGGSEKLKLTDHQAWSLNNRPYVTVAGAPTEDPRPWEDRAKTNEEIEELRDAKKEGPSAVAALIAKKNAALKAKASAPAPAADDGAKKTTKKGGDA